jgi:hypothetical protein
MLQPFLAIDYPVVDVIAQPNSGARRAEARLIRLRFGFPHGDCGIAIKPE